MSRDADIAVVGAGVVGAATARALARDGRSVLLLERFELGHTRGSSHGTSRIFRLNYPDEHFVRLARAADEAWLQLETERGERLIERVGCLDLGPVASETRQALASGGVRYESLSADEVRGRWGIHVDEDDEAVFQADGGYLHAERAFGALIGDATDGGVELRDRTHVRSISEDDTAVRLELDGGHITAGSVVVTAGAWTGGLLEAPGIPLDVVPTRETVVYLDVPDADRRPSVIDYGRFLRAGQAAYALAAPGVGLKAGLHHSGPPVDPDTDPEPDALLQAWVEEWVSSRYEDAHGVIRSETCLYTNTPDERFVLERHGRIVVGSACSGHGFKFAPVVGRTLAALALDAAA